MADPNQELEPTPASPEAPPAPETMSTGQTLGSIFFDPGRVFESFRAKPRFLAAGLIIIVAVVAVQVLVVQRLGYENIVRAQIEASPFTANMTAEQKDQAVERSNSPVSKAIRYVIPAVFWVIIFAVGGLLYLLGGMAMAKSVSYKQALSVWIYSILPPVLLLMLLNIVMLFVKKPEEIDLTQINRGLVHANLSLLVDATSAPVVATALGAIDVFAIYGLILAALGMRKVGRMSTGASWTIVIAVWAIGMVLKLAFSAISKSALA